MGPAILIAVGYMDPGNWATNLAAGAHFGYAHLFVVLLACTIAMFIQSLCVTLGVATGRDLAQACRDAYPRPLVLFLWAAAEVAIAATDVAEVIGSAIAIQLLNGLPLAAGAVITLVDVLLFSLLLSRVRLVEGVVAVLIAFIAVAFIAMMGMSTPPAVPVALGFLPSAGLVTDSAALYVAIGIVGATVMPHNLYLHSALVQSRAITTNDEGKVAATRFLTGDAVLALTVALFVNASILITAATAFNATGNSSVADLESAYSLLAPLLGSAAAPILFAVALLAAGQNSTLTGVMAGQVVMEGFLQWRISPTLRRLVTRLVTLVPVLAVTLSLGNAGINSLLVLSQVVLSFQLPFALVPLMHFTSDASKMGALVNSWAAHVAGWVAVVFISILNAYLVIMTIRNGI